MAPLNKNSYEQRVIALDKAVDDYHGGGVPYGQGEWHDAANEWDRLHDYPGRARKVRLLAEAEWRDIFKPMLDRQKKAAAVLLFDAAIRDKPSHRQHLHPKTPPPLTEWS